MRRKVSILSFMLFVASFAWGSAASVYIAQSSAGSNNGTSCANAYAYTFFNSSSNWGSGSTQIGPGSTVHLCGTFTAAAGADSYLQFQESGTSGNPITLLWESGAIVQSPYFSSAHGGIDLNGETYITLNGGINGIVQNTANGTGRTYQQASKLVDDVGSNTIIENLSMINVYVHTNGDSNGGDSIGLYARDPSNLHVGPNNTFTQADLGINFIWDGGTSNLVIDGNHFAECNQDIEAGTANGSTTSFTNMTVSNNTATNWANWDDAGNDYHHNFFHPFTNTPNSSLVGTLLIYNNRAIGDMGNHSTSMLFLENNNGSSGGTMGTWYIFNNVFSKTNANAPSSSGIIAPMSDNGYAVNNTIIDAGGTGSNAYPCFDSYGTGWTFKNNVDIGCGSYIQIQGTTATANNNDYYGAASPQWIWHSSYVSTLSAWQTASGQDASAISTNPNLTSGYVPNAGSPVIGAGTNLTSLGITALNVDAAGNARPSSGAWDMGAFSSGSVRTPGAPINLQAVPR
ncbi:MAG: choice-of-anchor Q domain-containing protein [Acidobacteriaceae bacterium]